MRNTDKYILFVFQKVIILKSGTKKVKKILKKEKTIILWIKTIESVNNYYYNNNNNFGIRFWECHKQNSHNSLLVIALQ